MFSLDKHSYQKENKPRKQTSFVEEVEMHEYEDDGDSDSEDDWWDDGSIRKQNITLNQKNVTNKQKSSLQPQEKQFGKYINKIKVEQYEGTVSASLQKVFSNCFVQNPKFQQSLFKINLISGGIYLIQRL